MGKYGSRKKSIWSTLFFVMLAVMVILAWGYLSTNQKGCPNGRKAWTFSQFPPGYACFSNY